MITTLNKLPTRKVGTIKKLNVRNEIKKRLLELGFCENSKIKLLYKSPLGDPTAYLIKGSVIALRNDDAKNIIISFKKEDKDGVN